MISDTTPFASGYGGNSGNTVVNRNVDSFWIVTKLSATYNPRHSYPLTYTGTYLSVGQNPYVIKTTANYLSGYWSIFNPAGSCLGHSTTDSGSSRWLSVYTEAGGQTIYSFDTLYDGFRFDRCIANCQSDSLTFDLSLLADDIIDTVMLDGQYIYTAPTALSTTVMEFDCAHMVTARRTLWVPAGRHFFRVWIRDLFHGHIGMNIYGSVTSRARNMILPKYDEKCTTAYTSHPVAGVTNADRRNSQDLSVFPNPGDGKMTIVVPGANQSFTMELYDAFGKMVMQQTLTSGTNYIVADQHNGVYFMRVYNATAVMHRQIVIGE